MVHGIEDTKKSKKKSPMDRAIENTKDLAEAGRLIGNGVGRAIKEKVKN